MSNKIEQNIASAFAEESKAVVASWGTISLNGNEYSCHSPSSIGLKTVPTFPSAPDFYRPGDRCGDDPGGR